jgi:hypothetical protein
MTDFQLYNSGTHPIVRLQDDWNNLLDHGLEKEASFIIRKNGSYYEAIQGGGATGAGTIVYGSVGNIGGASGSSAVAVVQAALNALTAGRTWKETVIVKCDGIYSTLLNIPEYAVLIVPKMTLQGADIASGFPAPNDYVKLGVTLNNYSELHFDHITQSAGANIQIMITSTAKAAKNDIKIIGRLLDVNYANQSYPDRTDDAYYGEGISNYGDRWTIIIDRITNCGQYGGCAIHGADNYIRYHIDTVTAYSPARDYYAAGFIITSTLAMRNDAVIWVNGVDGAGVMFEDEPSRNKVVAFCNSCGTDSVMFIGGNYNDIWVQSAGAAEHGVNMWKGSPAITLDHNTISGKISSSGKCGVILKGATYTTINADFEDNAVLEAASEDSDIRMETSGAQPSVRTRINSAFRTNSGKTRHFIEESDVNQDYTLVSGCDFSGTTKDAPVKLLGLSSREAANGDSVKTTFSVPFITGTHTLEIVWKIPMIKIDTDLDEAALAFRVPNDFKTLVSASLIWMANAIVADMAISVGSNITEDGGTINGSADSATVTQTTASNTVYESSILSALNTVAAGDLVGLLVSRPNAGNTNAKVIGIKIEYI